MLGVKPAFSHSFQLDVQQLAVQFLCSICHWRVFHFVPPLIVPMKSKGWISLAPGINIVPSSDHRFQWSRFEELRAIGYLLIRSTSTFVGDALKKARGQHAKSGIGHGVLNFVYHGFQTARSIGAVSCVYPQPQDVCQPGRHELWLRLGRRQRVVVRKHFPHEGHPILAGFRTHQNVSWRRDQQYRHTTDHIVFQCTSSTAQGGGGSFKNRIPIGEVGCCESWLAEPTHWWIKRWLESCFLKWLQWLQRSPHHNCWM